jgi:hypothetical protein
MQGNPVIPAKAGIQSQNIILDTGSGEARFILSLPKDRCGGFGSVSRQLNAAS